MSYTPGPWVAFPPNGGCIRVESAKKEYITTIGSLNNIPSQANANLIVAAPDLLNAIELLLLDWDSICGLQNWDENHLLGARLAREAIAKAKKDD